GDQNSAGENDQELAGTGFESGEAVCHLERSLRESRRLRRALKINTIVCSFNLYWLHVGYEFKAS
ncbi:MAG: hypothetical protein ABI197_04790, partial [Granulicella sp.]